MDSVRAASVLKNLHSLHVRIKQHSANAAFLAQRFLEYGVKVRYPGLTRHPQHELMKQMMNGDFGFGGMIVLNLDTKERAYTLMEKMQQANLGYLAVSLGFYKTLFSSPGSSTSSEIPQEERKAMGLTDGLVRMSIGLDEAMPDTWARLKPCLDEVEKMRVVVE